MAETAAPTLAQHQDVPTLSWEEDFEKMYFNDANFDDMLAELDREVIIGGTHNEQVPVAAEQVPPATSAA